MDYFLIILWVLGMIVMWIPEYGNSLTMMLWAYPSGIAVGDALGRIAIKDKNA